MSSVCSDHFSPSPSLIPLGTSSDLFLPFFLRPTINAQKSIPCAAPGLLPGVMAFDERTYEVSLGTTRMKHSGSPARFWLGAKQALVTIKACLWGIKIDSKQAHRSLSTPDLCLLERLLGQHLDFDFSMFSLSSESLHLHAMEDTSTLCPIPDDSSISFPYRSSLADMLSNRLSIQTAHSWPE